MRMGDKKYEGKKAVTEELERMKEFKAAELTIEHIITHGRTAACNGSLVMKRGGNKYAFCDIYDFDKNGKNAKIRKMISYGISLG